MLYLLFLLLLLVIQACNVVANTEKVIFLGPGSLQVPKEHPTLEDLKPEALSPRHWSVRTHVRAEFPTETSKNGQSTWLLLQGLQEGQRYEVRICWAATQPTSFHMDTYDLPSVFDTPDLITSLARYSESRQSNPIEAKHQLPGISKTSTEAKHTYDDVSSTLFLHIQAAADYYTMNRTIMEHVPPVFVDIILDPYIFNVLPRSLVPTIAYIITLAIGAWYLAKYINKWVQVLVTDDVKAEKKNS